MADKVFVKGIRSFKPNEKAPDFVLGTVIITPNELFAWLKAEGAEHLTEYKDTKQLKLQVTKSRAGDLMFTVDTFKPTPKVEDKPAPSVAKKVVEDDLPF